MIPQSSIAIWTLAGVLAIFGSAAHAQTIVTAPGDSGPGTLREAIDSTPPGGTITFDPTISGDTIVLLTPLGPFNDSLTIDSTSIGGVTITGSDLQKTGTGTLRLLGGTVFDGDISVQDGELVLEGAVDGNVDIDSGARLTLSGSINGDVTVDNGGTLAGAIVVSTGNTFTVNGQILGNTTVQNGGTLNLTGTLNGDVAIDTGGTLTGNTNVTAGRTLAVNGVLNGTTNIASSANLLGTGLINGNATTSGRMNAGLAINDRATLSFGNNLNINNGTVVVDIDDGGTTPGVNNDLYAATGDVTLNGGTVSVVTNSGTYADGTVYTFMTSGGTVTGTFAGINDDLPFFDAVLIYNANSVAFEMTDVIASFADLAQTCNQRSLGEYLELLRPSATGDLEDIIDALRSSNLQTIQASLDQFSGQIYPALATAQIQHTSFSLAMLRDQLAVDTHTRPVPARTRGWIRGYGIGGDTEADDCGTQGFGFESGGTEIVLQRGLTNEIEVGIFTNLAWSDVRINDLNQVADIDSYMLGGSAQYTGQYAYLLGIGGGGYQQYEASRAFAVPGTVGDRVATSRFDGSQAFGYFESGLILPASSILFVPHLSWQYIHVDQDAFEETGADAINLVGNSIDADSLRSILGLTIQQTGQTGLGPATTKLRVGWMHEYLDAQQLFEARFDSAVDTFAVQGVDLGRDWAVLGGNLQWSVFRYATALLAYQGQVNERQSLHTGAAGLEFRW
jgi:uncharacterized protein with beta-barrel porin domain